MGKHGLQVVGLLSGQKRKLCQFWEVQDYLYSIPQNELTLNPDPEQNPDWLEIDRFLIKKKSYGKKSNFSCSSL